MTGRSPAAREAAAAWELRGAWAAQREVVVTAGRWRVRGFVAHVAPTGAFAMVWDGRDEVHVPLAQVGAVRRPHFTEPMDGAAVPRPAPRRALPMLPGQLALDLGGA